MSVFFIYARAMRGLDAVETDSSRLRRARLAAGLTVADVAVAADLSEATIRAWETGKRPRASSSALKKVADLLGVPVVTFIAGEQSGLARHRFARGWTVTEAATRAGLSYSTVAHAERGTESLSDRTRDALAQLYNVPVEQISADYDAARAARVAAINNR